MKKSRFSDSQILAILKQHEAGVPVSGEVRVRFSESVMRCARIAGSPRGEESFGVTVNSWPANGSPKVLVSPSPIITR